MLDFAESMTEAEKALKASYNSLALRRFSEGEDSLKAAIKHLRVALISVQELKADARVFR